jgi:molecular chaperone Hsp33
MNENFNMTDDVVQPFQLETSHLRGRLVRLGPALNLILRQHNYEPPVATLLGEAVVVAAALATSLKYEGVFTLQAKGDGAVRMIVADVTSEGDVRGYAQLTEGVKALAGDARLLGKGYLAFTVDQKKKDDRYQGIVELSAGTLAEAVQHYFRQSEQLPTGIVAAVRQDDTGQWRGGCLMVQKMPREGGMPVEQSDRSSEDDWIRAMMLMDTCGADELTHPTLKPNELLFRLFHEEGVRVYEPHLFRHKCRCSEDRVTNMLRSLPREEIEEMAVNGLVSVTCEFCNRSYLYDRKRRDELYAGVSQSE